jgi:hypothetical protein
MSDHETRPASSRWHDRLRAGDRLSAQPLLDDPLGSFEGDLQLAPLEPMLVPERPRKGELDPAECGHCHQRDDWGGWIWRDDLWHVGTPPTFGIPFWAGLAPNAHVRLDELGPDLLTSFGSVVQRLAGAIQGLDAVARTHFARWGDGSAHFHMAFLGRPLGMMQARGYMLAVWDDVLPPMEKELVDEYRREVAAAMAAGGGEALV